MSKPSGNLAKPLFAFAWAVALTLPVGTAAASEGCPAVPTEADLVCPNGATRLVEGASADTRGFGGIWEEGCWVIRADSTRVRQGPFVVWGPDHALLQFGTYANGKKNGAWHTWTPKQIVDEYWTSDRLDSSFTLAPQDSVAIDFCACRPSGWLIYTTFGSNSWTLRDAGTDSCRLETYFEEEGGVPPKRVYVVPRRVGRLVFPAPGGHLDFSSLEPYFRGTVGKAHNILLDR